MNNLTMQRDLIIDVGMHRGKDTLFYLQKGFRVVAIEANPELVSRNSLEFAPYIKQGLLQIVPLAISDKAGKAIFYLNQQVDDWGTMYHHWAERNVLLGTESVEIEVETVRFETLLEQYGIPYYLKIDIEGSDLLCVQALSHFQSLPKYVSMELSHANFAKMSNELDHLYRLGYRKFKLVNQLLNHTYRCPDPPLEGKYVDVEFDGHTSGPFGEETPGEWLSAEKALSRIKHLSLVQQFFLPEGIFYNKITHKLYTVWCRHFTKPKAMGWYDLHARLD